MKQTLFILALAFAQPLFAQTPATDSTLVDIGYAKIAPVAITVPVTHVDARQFNQGLLYDWNQLWQGQVAGLLTARPGSNPHDNFETRIHGLRTSQLRTQPLYVLDGVPGVDIYAIDPADIASVEVLRGAAASAIYGGRGAAGVVLLHTKTPQKGLHIRYQAQVGTETASRRYTVMQAPEYILFGGINQFPNDNFNTDWQSQVLRRATNTAHHLNISDSWRNGFVRADLHYRNQQAIIQSNDFEQLQGNLAVGQSFLKNKIQINAGVNTTQRKQNLGFSEAYRYAVVANPTTPVTSTEPRFNAFDGYTELNLFDYYNPVAMYTLNQNLGKQQYVLGHASATAELIPGFKLTAMVAQEQNNTATGTYISPKSKWFDAVSYQGISLYDGKTQQRSVLETQASIDKKWSKLQFNAIAGYGWQQTDRTNTQYRAQKVPDNLLNGYALNQFGDNLKNLDTLELRYNPRSKRQDYNLVSFWGNIHANWDDTYFLGVTARKDGAGQLGLNGRWMTFPSLSVGVNAAKWIHIKTLDVLKLRFAHGSSGMIPDAAGYAQLTYANSTKIYYNGAYRPSVYPVQNENTNLTYERTTENNLGLDFSLWKNRISGSFDWFKYTNKTVMNVFYARNRLDLANYTWANDIALSGSGFDFSATVIAVEEQQFGWELGFVASRSKTKINDLGLKDDPLANAAIIEAPGGGTGGFTLNYSGMQLGELWGFTNDGIDAAGTLQYVDYNKNGNVSNDDYDDKRINGNGIPNWEIGVRQQLHWNNWDLSLATRSVTGHDLTHTMRFYYEAPLPFSTTWNRVKTKYFEPTIRGNVLSSDRYVERATFHRLQYLRVGYQFKWKNNKKPALKLNAGCNNLFTITRYTGLDPEVRLADSFSGNRFAAGIDRRRILPPARAFWIGVEAGF